MNAKSFRILAMAVDPVHVGTGGARLGRVDLTIVRDPVTLVPKIPGSSLAGVCRAYAAMEQQERAGASRSQPYYPDCAGQGQPDTTGRGGHCGSPDCPICTVFGFARGTGGGFAGLAAFSDAYVLLFPVPTREGPIWVTCPDALRKIEQEIPIDLEDAVYQHTNKTEPLNLGWILLPRKNSLPQAAGWPSLSQSIPSFIQDRLAIISDKLFSQIVNSNLEVRTSVSVNPATGAAEEGALFSYEALPRATVVVWHVVCKNSQYFRIGGHKVSAQINGKKIGSPDEVFEVVQTAHPYLEHLGIGAMGTRGMGRLRVLCTES